jgi:hypothetical protein
VLAAGLIALAAFAVPIPTTTSSIYDPVVGPELAVANPVAATPQRGLEPAIASGANVHLVVWRPDTGGVRATRIDAGGRVMDAPGILLTSGEPGGWSPAVAFDGENFLVAWLGTNTVRAKRVSPDGVVLDETGIDLSAPSQSLRYPAIAFDGTNYLVVWTDIEDKNEARGDVYGTLVRPNGTVAGPRDIRITDAVGYKERPTVAFNGSHYLVVWDEYPVSASNVRGTLVTTSGLALTPAGFDISAAPADQSNPVVTAVGTSFFVAWTDFRGGPDVYGARIDAAGSVVDPTGIPIAATADLPSIASDGRNVLVAYQTREESPVARGVRVDASGTVLDPAGFRLPTPGRDPVLAFDGDSYFVAAGDLEPIRGTRVTPGGAVLDPAGIAISMSANNQTGVDMASDGTNSFVVWSDDRTTGDGGGLYGARVGPDGQILDDTGFLIAGAGAGNHPTDASVAFDGRNYLVVWSESQEQAIRAARVTRSGIVLGRFDIAVTADPDDVLRSPEVAFGGGGLLVVWTSSAYRGGDYVYELRGARVSTGGDVLDPTGLLISPLEAHETVDVAFGRSNFMVVWPDERGDSHKDIYGTRVTTAGVVSPPGGFPIAATEGWQLTPQIAWNGTTHLVVWADASELLDPRTSDIRGARIDDAGTVLDPAGVPISSAPNGQQSPTVAANGPFLVAWLDRRNGVDGSRAVLAGRVDSDGAVAHDNGFMVIPSIGSYHGAGVPVAAARGEETFAIGYERFRAKAPHGSTRAALRLVAPK